MTSLIDNLNEADRLLHSLAQLLARTGTNQLPNQPDDSQANLNWNAQKQHVEGRPFDHDSQQIRLVINLSGGCIQFVTVENQSVALFVIDGKTPDEVVAWWHEVLHGWGLKTDKPLSYQLDHEPITPQMTYTWPADMGPWVEWRTVANETLQTLNDQTRQFSEVRIWPHHFDTGVYYSFPDKTGNERAAIWAGYAVADALSQEPYFYLSGYNTRQPVNFSIAPPLTVGHWLVTPNWNGAFLAVSEASSITWVSQFFKESYDWLCAAIEH